MDKNIPQDLPKEINDKYTIENNTFKQEVKDNPKDRIQVEIGDSKQPDFKPQIKIMRWDNEVNFSMRAIEDPNATVEIDKEVIKYITPDYEVHQYDKPDASENGGHEFEWVLPKKPTSNILTATIQTKGLDFFYQPPLTQQEIDEGSQRPDNVVGSYAVYHKTKGGMNDSVGMEYKVGKAFHIYRPKVTDANGVETWGELNVDEQSGFLTVTIDQDFLDNAVYPVIVDPTFGYTSIGASGVTLNTTGATVGGKYTPVESGTVSMISLRSSSLSSNARGFLATVTGSAIVTNGISDITATSSGAGAWTDYLYSTEPSITAQEYFLMVQIESDTSWSLKYDADSGTQVTDGNNWATPVNPTSPTETGSRIVSIYATYTAAGGGSASATAFMTTNTQFWGT